MIAIITGDIINSEDYKQSEWMSILKKYLSTLGKTPTDWEIYRGDEFQVHTTPEKALEVAIYIKSLIKSIKGLDVRMGIGLGNETFTGESVSESNGTAHQRSGHIFDSLRKKKLSLAIAMGDNDLDKTLNLLLKLALDFMDDWSIVSAEIVTLFIQNPNASQKEIAKMLNIKQSAVSQRQKRARLDLVLELLEYYNQIIKEINI